MSSKEWWKGNEPATTLLGNWRSAGRPLAYYHSGNGNFSRDLEAALAAERRIVEAECDERIIVVRRATVERIRERLGDAPSDNVVVKAIRAILDEEAAR